VGSGQSAVVCYTIPIVDPLIGPLIGVVIVLITRDTARTIWYRLMDGIDPAIINRTYAVDVQTGRFSPVMAGFACGSMVLFYLFHKHVAL
jgi:hypothetical protein